MAKMRITNLSQVKLMFDLLARDVPKEARTTFKMGVEQIVQTAIDFAPVDEYRLEKAIKALPFRGNQYTLKAVIDVSGFINGRDVSTYATIVHEYPWSKRGPKTRAKSPRAGPRYLMRAVEAHKKELIAELGSTTAKAVDTAVRRSGVNRRRRR